MTDPTAAPSAPAVAGAALDAAATKQVDHAVGSLAGARLVS